jgi:predicted AAA+ superfamily ATPase
MMKTIFELCQPRDEVLKGSLSEDIFAARLKDVIDKQGDAVYQDPRLFFENTFPTSGLKTLLTDALGRLVGDATGKNAIIRLETAFGGGKTHNLIALYHAASGHAPADLLEEFIQPGMRLPKPGEIKIAAAVGSDQSAASGLEHPEESVKTYTLWGELAYQLGGRAGLALVQESEKLRSSPGTGFLETLIGNKPTLIMLDEIARQLRAELAVPTATGRTSQADQTVAFLMSLLEFAASKERCLVVLTLASQSDAFSNETNLMRANLAKAGNISARQERVLTPTNEGEVYSIVTHRLFKSIDREGARAVFQGYAAYYREMIEKNADLPQRCLRAEYLDEMEKAYPFHPELLTTLSLKTATIPNFNQTRGALRLLAWTIRSLWERRPVNVYAIQHHHINLADPQVAEDLTSRLDRPKFKQVIEADITSSAPGIMAHAQEVDQKYRAAGKPPMPCAWGPPSFCTA